MQKNPVYRHVNDKVAHSKQQVSELGFLFVLHVDIGYRHCALQLKSQFWYLLFWLCDFAVNMSINCVFYINLITERFIKLCQNVIFLAVRFFCDTLRRVATVGIETAQMVLSQFKNFLTQSIENWIRSYQK